MVFDWRCPSVRSNSARDLSSFTFLAPKAAVCWVLWHLVSLQGEAKWMVASRASVCFAHMVKIWWKRTSSVTKTEINTQQLLFFPWCLYIHRIFEYLLHFFYCSITVAHPEAHTFEPLKHKHSVDGHLLPFSATDSNWEALCDVFFSIFRCLTVRKERFNVFQSTVVKMMNFPFK